ncbi:MAG: GatB/YqeY domain-containing protein [Azospirillaceae bacterium]
MIRQRFNEALKDAMRAKDEIALATVRLILAALKDRDIAARSTGNTEGIPDDDVLNMLQTMVKQRRESISLYEQGGRLDLAEQEAAEIAVIQRFLPKQMDEGEIKVAVDGVIKELNASSLKDMGRTMAALRDRYAGQMDFGKASGIVKTQLA